MELKILDKKEEPLLSRTRIEAEVVFENATPSGQEIKSNLAKTIGKDEKLIDVKSIYTVYGLKKAKILFYAYENEEILKRIKVEKKEIEKKPKVEKESKPEAKKEEKAEAKEAKKESKEQKPEGKKKEKRGAKEQKAEDKKEPEKKGQ